MNADRPMPWRAVDLFQGRSGATLVRFSHPRNGRPGEQESSSRYLYPGAVYSLASRPNDWQLILHEIPYVRFASSQFTPLEQGHPTQEQLDPEELTVSLHRIFGIRRSRSFRYRETAQLAALHPETLELVNVRRFQHEMTGRYLHVTPDGYPMSNPWPHTYLPITNQEAVGRVFAQ